MTKPLKQYVIERDIPGIDQSTPDQLKGAAAHSNEVLSELGDRVKWLQSFVVKNKTFCIYEAEDEDVIREHARLSGFPANTITEVVAGISPKTAG